MYLLNRSRLSDALDNVIVFTFHYVSIKSPLTLEYIIVCLYLHSTMYLLNPGISADAIRQSFNLHSTMYLLNLG